VFEHVLQADLVVHVGLQAFDALVLHFVPFGIAGKETERFRLKNVTRNNKDNSSETLIHSETS
jgi:hypothetical protein